MKKSELNRSINKKVRELAENAGCSRTEMLRQLIVSGIRNYPDHQDFLKPYPGGQS